MENIWDYVMRRKPLFLGYLALFLISVFASCQLLSNIMPQNAIDEPSIVQEPPQPEQYDRVLSPESVALLAAPEDTQDGSSDTVAPEPTISLNFVQVDVANPAHSTDLADPTGPADPAHSTSPADAGLADPVSQISQSADGQPAVDIPLTGATSSSADVAPRKVSIFRTVLAVLLAVTALTLAGLGLYQAYDYFSPYIEKYLQNNR